MEKIYEIPESLANSAKEFVKSDCRKRGYAAVNEYYRIYATFFKQSDGTICIPKRIVDLLEECEKEVKQ